MKKLITLLGSVFSLSAQMAWGHSLPINHGTINVSANTAYLVLALPVQALINVDDDADGKLSYQELNRHHQAIKQQIISGFHFVNQRGAGDSDSQSLRIISLTPTVEENATAHSHTPLSDTALQALQTTHLTTLAVVRFDEDIAQLQVNSDFFKTTPPSYQFTLFAKHAGLPTETTGTIQREKAVLTARQTTAVFFGQ